MIEEKEIPKQKSLDDQNFWFSLWKGRELHEAKNECWYEVFGRVGTALQIQAGLVPYTKCR